MTPGVRRLRAVLKQCTENGTHPEGLKPLSSEDSEDVVDDWPLWGRGDQTPPDRQDWQIWLVLGGRGAGKTRVGAEWVKARINARFDHGLAPARRIALVAPTLDEARHVMVEGVSGLLSVHRLNEEIGRPLYEPSKRQLTWPNGAVAQIFSAEEPDSLRGPQFDLAWCDELAKWKHADAVFDMLTIGLGGYVGGRSLEKIATTIAGKGKAAK
jgi:phage terminase large subunit-like protein